MKGDWNIFGEHQGSASSNWMSTTDLMSGLMIVFMFIAIAHMTFLAKKDKDTYEIAREWNRTKIKLVNALHQEFDKDLKNWGAEINDKELSMKFTAPEILFEKGSYQIKKRFKEILKDFCPRYISLLYNYQLIISEIRIEGHTSIEWKKGTPVSVAYLKNIELSQDRSRSVLGFCLERLKIHSK